MVKKAWGEAETISAYLDGQLDLETRAAFESAMEQDPALRRQVDDMRQVVTLMRSTPLQQPPRNYLLTPSVVAEAPSRQEERRRMPFFVMRLATSLTAAAFVVTMALNFLGSAANPAMITQKSVEVEFVQVATERVAEVEVEQPPREAPAPTELEESEAGDRSAQGEIASAPAPGVGATAPAGMEGGDGAPAPVEGTPPPDVGSATEEGEAVAAFQAEETAEAGTLGAAALPTETPQPEKEAPALSSGQAGITATQSPAEGLGAEAAETTPVGVSPFPPRWLASVLGVATLVMAGITFWLSRRR